MKTASHSAAYTSKSCDVVAVPSGTYDVRFCSQAYHERVDSKIVVAGECTNLDAALMPIL
jgi:hypothetical protein